MGYLVPGSTNKGALRSFNPGDKVYLFTPRATKDLSRKFHHYWSGPFLIKEKLAPTTYKVVPAPGVFPRKIDPIVAQVDRLKVYTESDDIITPPVDLHLGIGPNNEAAARIDPLALSTKDDTDLFQIEDPVPPKAPWEPSPPPQAPLPKATRKRPKAKSAAARQPTDISPPPKKLAKRSLRDYPAIALGKKANGIKKTEFTQLPPPMRTRGATRRQLESNDVAPPAAVATLDTPAIQRPISDADLAESYACDDNLVDQPSDDPSYFHRLAALDDMEDANEPGTLKHMLRGSAYNGFEPITTFSVQYDSAGIRTITS